MHDQSMPVHIPGMQTQLRTRVSQVTPLYVHAHIQMHTCTGIVILCTFYAEK